MILSANSVVATDTWTNTVGWCYQLIVSIRVSWVATVSAVSVNQHMILLLLKSLV